MFKIENSNLNIWVEESKENEIQNPEYFLKHDRIVMKDGSEFVVTKADSDKIELQMMTRPVIQKGDIQSFLEKMSHIKRAECFERK